jgi:hypothetical protein
VGTTQRPVSLARAELAPARMQFQTGIYKADVVLGVIPIVLLECPQGCLSNCTAMRYPAAGRPIGAQSAGINTSPSHTSLMSVFGGTHAVLVGAGLEAGSVTVQRRASLISAVEGPGRGVSVCDPISQE